MRKIKPPVLFWLSYKISFHFNSLCVYVNTPDARPLAANAWVTSAENSAIQKSFVLLLLLLCFFYRNVFFLPNTVRCLERHYWACGCCTYPWVFPIKSPRKIHGPTYIGPCQNHYPFVPNMSARHPRTLTPHIIITTTRVGPASPVGVCPWSDRRIVTAWYRNRNS